MFKYEQTVLPYIQGEYKINDKGQLQCLCPFHYEEDPSCSIDLERGLYNCFSCGRHGNMVTFLAEMEGITTKEAYKMIAEENELQKYADKKKISFDYLKSILGLENGKSCIKIPYYDENHKLIRMRFRNSKKSKKSKFKWGEGSITPLYGLWTLKEANNDYIVLVEGESDAQSLWYNGFQALGVPGASNLKPEFASIFEKFDRVYVHNEGDRGAENLIKSACKIIPYDKLYLISARKIDIECKDPSDLHIKGLLDKNSLLGTAEQIDKAYYDEVNQNTQKTNTGLEDNFEDELEEHVRIAEEIMQRIHIRYYNEDFYVYKNGVYRRNRPLIEQEILKIEPNAKSYLRKEILEYIRINKYTPKIQINEQYVNCLNGLYDIVNNRLIEHSPNYFTTCQNHMNYYADNEIPFNKDVDNFLDDICCNNYERRQAILQVSGETLTFKIHFAKATFLYGPTAKNGKSTFIEMLNALVGSENICHITIGQLGERFVGSELTDKLLNTETEIEKNSIRNVEVFKKVVTRR